MTCKICLLADEPDAAAAAARLMQLVWPDHYGPRGAGNATSDLNARARRVGLPCGFVAMDAARVLGVATIAETSFGADAAEGHWLVGLCVQPDWRGRGVGSQLVAAAECFARNSGASQIMSTTQAAYGLLQRRNWSAVRDVQDDAGTPWVVMRRDLA